MTIILHQIAEHSEESKLEEFENNNDVPDIVQQSGHNFDELEKSFKAPFLPPSLP